MRRRRSGRGFSYYDSDSERVSDLRTRERIQRLAIPPAWSDVWISPYPNGHIQACGTDDAGRRQYLYHAAWTAHSDRVKFDRILDLADSLSPARRAVTIALRTQEPTEERALAAAFRLLDLGSLRVGSERYADANNSHGLATLLCSHATVHAQPAPSVELNFPAKSGQSWQSTIVDTDLAKVVARLKRRGPAERLLAFYDNGQWHALSPQRINDYVRERTGGEFTAKDFRTLRGTTVAAVSLANAPPPTSQRDSKRAITEAIREVAEVLGNTPAVARSSYVDPRVIDQYHLGVTLGAGSRDTPERRLRALVQPQP
nr:DNA topoisomerase IB [Lysinibacter cavernae]